MDNETILMIASGMKKSKKPFIKNSVENIYLNYGLLGLGSILYDKGYTKVKMFQGDSKTIQEMFDEIASTEVDIKKIKYPVFISVPSFFAISWAIEFINEIKSKSPNIKIILGGRWVLDQNLDWCKEIFTNVNFFSLGCSDEIIDMLLEPNNWSRYQSVQISKKPFSRFYFNILNNFKEYQPVIEICRGCGRGCEFCLEKHYPVSIIKSAEEVILEAKSISEIYGTDDLNFYFQASIFNPSVTWSKEFLDLYKKYNMKFHWRFETRVDTISLESLEILVEAGLKVIDLGLESASVHQIERMGKSKNPKKYLARADKLLHKMYELGIWSKVNLLLYVGETNKTINETIVWLEERRKYIKGVSVNPIIVYLNGNQTQDFIKYIDEETLIEVNRENLDKFGYTFISLSKEINIVKSQEITNMLVKKFMTNEDYLMLKNVCYTRRSANGQY
ncbi:B12-binding domain-containing radical SAM protein [Lacrimispora brassicae]